MQILSVCKLIPAGMGQRMAQALNVQHERCGHMHAHGCAWRTLKGCLKRRPTGVAWACRWFPDDLGIPSFARLHELRKLPVAHYDGRYDIWTIEAVLSEGCGGPELPEEVML